MSYKLKNITLPICVSRIANIHYFEFSNDYHTSKNKHPFCELVYVDNEEIFVESDSYTGILQKNQLIVHNANEMHALSCPSNKAPSIIIIGFECEHTHQAFQVLTHQPVTLSTDEQKLLANVINEGRSVYFPPYDLPNVTDMKKRSEYPFGADQLIKLNLETMFISLIRNQQLSIDGKANKKRPINSKVQDIKSYVDENYKLDISLENLCMLFYTNKTALCTEFKRLTGTSVINYINVLRIKEAKRMLRERKLNITAIAQEVGFTSVHYFNRVFKNYQKCSPTDYIKSVKSRLES